MRQVGYLEELNRDARSTRHKIQECLHFLICTVGLVCVDTQLIAQYFAFPQLTDRRPFCAVPDVVYFHDHKAGSLRCTINP